MFYMLMLPASLQWFYATHKHQCGFVLLYCAFALFILYALFIKYYCIFCIACYNALDCVVFNVGIKLI